MRRALSGVSTLFLLNAVVPDEFTQALIALNLAREAGIERVVYLSVICERFASEGMIPDPGDVARLTTLLGRPLRSYRDFAREVAASV